MPPTDPQRLSRLRAHLIVAAAVAVSGCKRDGESTTVSEQPHVNRPYEPHVNQPATHTVNNPPIPTPVAHDASAAAATIDASAAGAMQNQGPPPVHAVNPPPPARPAERPAPTR